MPSLAEMPEVNYENPEFLCEALDCMNPFYEPGNWFEYDDDFHVPDHADVSLHLEL